MKIKEISQCLDIDRDTVSLVISSWETIGIIGLYDDKRSGRPPIFNESDKEIILSKVKEEPRQLKSLVSDIKARTGKDSSVDTIKRVVKKEGFIWKRIKKN